MEMETNDSPPQPPPSLEEEFRQLCRGGKTSECQATIEQHPELDVNGKDEYGFTALHWAAEAGDLDLVKWLVLSCGANIHSVNGDGAIPLHSSLGVGHMNIASWLAPRVREEKLLRFLLALHPRAGVDSSVRVLVDDVIATVRDFVMERFPWERDSDW